MASAIVLTLGTKGFLTLKNHGESRMSQYKFAYAVTAVIAIGLGLAGCDEKAVVDPRTQPELVRVVSVKRTANGTHEFTGVVSARVESSLGFRVPGKVTKRLVDPGQIVHVGQVLMTIDPTDYTYAITSRTETVAAAKAKAVQTAADEARYRGLVKTGAISASTYDQVKAGSDAAQAELQAAEAQEKVARDEGGYSTLIADADGVVVDTSAEPGQVVAAGQTVVKLAHAGPREASVNLSETVRPVLGSLATATIYGQAGSDRAKLRQLSDAAEPLTRTFEARYVLEGRAAQAPLGATVTILMDDPSREQLFEVPVAALIDRGGGPGVWVLNSTSSTVSFRPVQVQRVGEESAMLHGDLLSGTQVIAMGAHLLHDGQRVRVAQEKAAIQ
jgi:RND family efflux transporter MFP subunit